MKKLMLIMSLSLVSSFGYAMNFIGQGYSRNVEMTGQVTAYFYSDHAPTFQTSGYVGAGSTVTAVHVESISTGGMSKMVTSYSTPMYFEPSFEASDWGGDNGFECTPPDGKIY